MRQTESVYVLVITCFYLQLASCIDSFKEHLTVDTISQKHILVSLTFQQTHDLLDKHASTFPLAIKYLAVSTPLADLQLHLTRGRWDYEAWGAPTIDVHPPGAAVSVVWQSPGLHKTHWTRVMHRLSGLMCASLNLAMDPETAPSQHVRMTDGACNTARCDTVPGQQHTAWLPREAVCTENLTPWLKLLPCKGEAGLAGLLANRSRVFGADYHSMSLRLNVEEDAQGRGQKLLLTQTFSLVLQTSCQASSTCTLSTVLGIANPSTACSAAIQDIQLSTSKPRATAHAPTQSQYDAENTQDAGSNSGPNTGNTISPNLSAEQVQPEQLSTLHIPLIPSKPSAPPLLLHSSLSGMGLYAATLQLVIHQNRASGLAAAPAWPADYQQVWRSQQQGSTMVYAEAGHSGIQQQPHSAMGVVCIQQWVPWVLRIWLHTQHISVTSQDTTEDGAGLVFWQGITPAVDRSNPLLLTTCLYVPHTAKHIKLSWKASRAFLTLDEHPPDAHRGWDIPPAHLLYVQPGVLKTQEATHGTADDVGSKMEVAMQKVVGSTLLVQLATADTAMPYNVICLTSTVMAVFVGATFNVLMQRSTSCNKGRGFAA